MFVSVLLFASAFQGASENPDPSCLLQKRAADQQQVVVESGRPTGVQTNRDLCPENDCQCTGTTSSSPEGAGDDTDFLACETACEGFPAFNWLLPGSGQTFLNRCLCCRETDQIGPIDSNLYSAGTVYEKVYSPIPGRLEQICGEGQDACTCAQFAEERLRGQFYTTQRENCYWYCKSYLAFEYVSIPSEDVQVCKCCEHSASDTLTVDVIPVIPPEIVSENAVYRFVEGAAIVEGDPHIMTLDGKHYTLLKQGTFSLWHFSGVEAEASQQGQVTKVPVDWHIYAHYAGSQSFTKALLLVDKTGGSEKVLELTAEDCEWRARDFQGQWTATAVSGAVAPGSLTEFLVSKKGGAKGGHNHVRLSFNTQNGKAEVAVLSLSCRPRHSINLQMVMRNRADHRFVDGELQMGRRDFSKLAMLETSQSGDSEFAVEDSWQSLGGSEQAALYLMNQAEAPTLLSTCTGEAELEAKETCSKHLGGHSSVDAALFQDCVYDLCHGADETVAELAGELQASTRAAMQLDAAFRWPTG